MNNKILIAALLCCGIAAAVTTSSITHQKADDWFKGECKAIVVEPDNALHLGHSLSRATGAFVRSADVVAEAADGTLYVASGGTVSRCVQGGSNVTVLSFTQEKVTAMAVAKDGTLYAAVAPGGAIYSPGTDGTARRVADSGQKYIWAIRVTPEGDLVVATGSSGILSKLKVGAPGATPEVQFDSDEENITAIACDGTRTWVGTAPHGHVYRIDKPKSAFLALDTKMPQVTDILVASNGIVWVATTGENGGGATPAAAASSPVTVSGGTITLGGSASAAAAVSTSGTGGKTAKLFRIGVDGCTETYWEPRDKAINCLAEAQDGSLIVGGSEGRLYAVREQGKVAVLAQSDAKQVVWLSRRTVDRLVCNDPAGVFALSPTMVVSGRFQSSVITLKDSSRWGRIALDPGASGTIRIKTRSGNTDKPSTAWSEWQPVGEGGMIASPAASALQYAIELVASNGVSPVVRSVRVSYTTVNREPVIEDVTVGGDQVRPAPAAPAASMATANSVTPSAGGFTISLGGDNKVASTPQATPTPQPAARAGKQVSRNISWIVKDPNGDKLEYAVWIAKEGDRDALVPLAKELRTVGCTFDSREFADGFYVVKVRATDAPDNAPGAERSDERYSQAFLVDNTPPAILIGSVKRAGNTLDLSFEAKDALSTIMSVRLRIDAGQERVLVPNDGVYDAKTESFTVSLPLPADATAVRLMADDECDNSAGAVVRIPAK